MRNKFAYSHQVKICVSAFEELLESIFCFLLVVKVFAYKNACTSGSWFPRGQVNAANEAQRVPLLKRWLRDVSQGFVQTWALSTFQRWPTSICWAHFWDAAVSPGLRKLSCITPAADHQTVIMTFFGASLASGSVWNFSVQPLSWSSPAVIQKSAFCHTSHSDGGMAGCCCIQWEKTTLQNDDFFFSPHRRHSFIELFTLQFPSNAKWL